MTQKHKTKEEEKINYKFKVLQMDAIIVYIVFVFFRCNTKECEISLKFIISTKLIIFTLIENDI